MPECARSASAAPPPPLTAANPSTGARRLQHGLRLAPPSSRLRGESKGGRENHPQPPLVLWRGGAGPTPISDDESAAECAKSRGTVNTVTFRKHGTLGLRFWKGSGKLRVEWLTDDGLASSEPAIRPGCVVVAVQGTSLQGIGYQDALARVKDASRPLQLTFEEPAAAMETSDAMPEARPDLPPYLIFTFVRDPFLAFLSGAAEAVHRHRHGFRTGCPRPKAACLSVPCRGDVLTPLVEDVRARRCIGTQAFHVWPQVLKLAVRLPRPFGFVGRVEWLAREP